MSCTFFEPKHLYPNLTLIHSVFPIGRAYLKPIHQNVMWFDIRILATFAKASIVSMEVYLVEF